MTMSNKLAESKLCHWHIGTYSNCVHEWLVKEAERGVSKGGFVKECWKTKRWEIH